MIDSNDDDDNYLRFPQHLTTGSRVYFPFLYTTYIQAYIISNEKKQQRNVYQDDARVISF